MPTPAEIEALVAFLPRLYGEGVSLVRAWHGGKKEDGSWQLPHPDYEAVVEEFYRILAGDAWLDRSYDPEEAWRLLRDESLVRSASLAEVRSMLTFCVRGERFSDGHWAEMIEKGHVRRLLERLGELGGEGGSASAAG